jgi:hypothetical protein
MMPQQGLQEIDYNGPRSRYFDESPELNILATREAKYPTAGQTQIPTFAQPYVQKLQGGQQPVAGQPATGYEARPSSTPLYNGPTQAQWDQMKSQPATGYESAPSLGGQAPAGGKGGNPTSNGSTGQYQ